MSPLAALKSALLTVTARRARSASTRLSLLALCLVGLSACTDLPTGPGGIDRDQADHVMPAVLDARTRLTPSIKDIGIRQQVTLAISDLEFALRTSDRAKAQAQVQFLTSTLSAYGRRSSTAENPDVTAIALMLNAVSGVVDPSTVVK